MISQVPAIMEYLGKKLGYYPQNPTIQEQALLSQINFDLTDFVAEGRAPFHVLKPTGSYNDQKDNPIVIEAIKDFKNPDGGRLYKFLNHFEGLLKANQERLKKKDSKDI